MARRRRVTAPMRTELPRRSASAGASALLLCCVAFGACDARPQSQAYDRADSVVRVNRAPLGVPGDIRLGRVRAGRGSDFDVTVGKNFGTEEGKQVLRRLIALDSSGEFKQFSCGEPVPPIGFDLTLHRQRGGQEPFVTIGQTPELFTWGPQRCLAFGINYLVARSFAEVDTGPSADLGYKTPSADTANGLGDAGKRHARHWPTCNCAMSRDSAWVKNGPRETSIGANAH